jgi:glycerol-3-phosphate cytidylyltransferase-like family protein
VSNKSNYQSKPLFQSPTRNNTITFTLKSLSEESIQQRATVVTKCKPLVIVYHEAMWDVHIEPLTLLDTLVQLLGSNITTHITQLSYLQYNVNTSIPSSLVILHQ